MLQLIAIIAVILFVSQAQVDVIMAPASETKLAKLILLVLAVIFLFLKI